MLFPLLKFHHLNKLTCLLLLFLLAVCLNKIFYKASKSYVMLSLYWQMLCLRNEERTIILFWFVWQFYTFACYEWGSFTFPLSWQISNQSNWLSISSAICLITAINVLSLSWLLSVCSYYLINGKYFIMFYVSPN